MQKQRENTDAETKGKAPMQKQREKHGSSAFISINLVYRTLI